MALLWNTNLLYPHKKIIIDVITRMEKEPFTILSEGPFKERDLGPFTPFEGMYDIIKGKVDHYSAANFNIEVFKNTTFKDFSTEISNASNIHSFDKKNTLNTNEDDYRTDKLEEIDSMYIKHYLYGLMSAVDTREETAYVRTGKWFRPAVVKDEETGQIILEEKVYDTRPGESEVERKRRVKNELLKQLHVLHKGSIRCGTSLLSMIIAIDKVMNTSGSQSRISGTPKPSEVLSVGVWRVDDKGNLTDKWGLDANGHYLFYVFLDAMCGSYARASKVSIPVGLLKMYYESSNIIKSCFISLGISLGDEKPELYSTETLNKMKHTYILSNREVISNLSLTDSETWSRVLLSKTTLSDSSEDDIKVQDRKSYITEVKHLLASSFKSFTERGILSINSPYYKQFANYRNIYNSVSGRRLEQEYRSLVEKFIETYNVCIGCYPIKGMWDMNRIRYDEVQFIDSIVCDIHGVPILFKLTIGSGHLNYFHNVKLFDNLKAGAISQRGLFIYADGEVQRELKMCDLRNAYAGMAYFCELFIKVHYKDKVTGEYLSDMNPDLIPLINKVSKWCKEYNHEGFRIPLTIEQKDYLKVVSGW